ncbi:MAG: DUF305 domain-containing protein [Clostridium sp.]|nr:DUF305 domain-containing protein [Clostridium sp.]
MKSIVRNIILLVVIINNIFLSFKVSAVSLNIESKYVIENKQDLENFKDQLLNLSTASDVAVSFIKESICYGEAVKDISKKFIKYTDNEEVKKIAEEIILKQDKDLSVRNELLEEVSKNIIDNKEKEASYIEMYKRSLNDAFQKIHNIFTNTETLEEIYLNTMLVCYEGDLKMETTVLRYIDNESLRDEIKMEIEAENKQVNIMKDVLKNYKKSK